MDPEWGSKIPHIILIRVVFPDPLGPIRQTISYFSIEKFMFFKISSLPLWFYPKVL